MGGTRAGQYILVVEDHGPLLTVIQEILKMEGYTVFAAADGGQALQALKENVCPDLIVSDISMPRMDGYALLEMVRTHPKWTLIPFIFLTAWDEDTLETRGFRVEDYITKPFTPQSLVTTVRTWLERA